VEYNNKTTVIDVLESRAWLAFTTIVLVLHLKSKRRGQVGRSDILMLALSLAYPGDPQCRRYPYQYLFGRHLLVAPVVEPDISTYTVYLPLGDWVDLWTGEPIAGGQMIHREVPLSVIPVYKKQDMSIPHPSTDL
jgi:hypothetical protein